MRYLRLSRDAVVRWDGVKVFNVVAKLLKSPVGEREVWVVAASYDPKESVFSDPFNTEAEARAFFEAAIRGEHSFEIKT